MEVAALHALKQRIRANALNTIPLAMMAAYAFPTIATLALASTWYSQKTYFEIYMGNVREKSAHQKTDVPTPEPLPIDPLKLSRDNATLEERLQTYERLRLASFMLLSAASPLSIYKFFAFRGNMLPAVIKAAN